MEGYHIKQKKTFAKRSGDRATKIERHKSI